MDYRYLRSAFDIIVTGTLTSTFSWCISADKPLIYFDSNTIYPLADDNLRESLENSVFYINIDNKNWEIELLKYLKLPYKELINEWKNKSEFRKNFIKEYIFSDVNMTGYKSAKFINKIIQLNNSAFKYN